jgi:hypothetical protein
MYSMENYIWGLVAYVLGVLMLTPLIWWLSRAIPWHPVKAFFRILVLVFLLTPAYPIDNTLYLAPAWSISLFEFVKPHTEQGILRGLLPIAWCFGVIYTVDLCLWLLLRKSRGPLWQARTPVTGKTK